MKVAGRRCRTNDGMKSVQHPSFGESRRQSLVWKKEEPEIEKIEALKGRHDRHEDGEWTHGNHQISCR